VGSETIHLLLATVARRMKRLAFSTTSRVFLSLFALNPSDESLSVTALLASTPTQNHQLAPPCRSNATHIVWKQNHCFDNDDDSVERNDGGHLSTRSISDNEFGPHETTFEQTSPYANPEPCRYFVQTRNEAEQDCIAFLKNNVMAFDKPFLETMGFPGDDDTSADGLDYGLVQPNIRLALDAKVQYPWTDDLPRHIFFDYVLNYANLNEARTNWRPLLVEALQFNTSDLYLSGDANITSVTTWVNTHLWTLLAHNPQKPIYFKSSQTPLIFDPMSTIAFGYASCTGTSILFCNALRAVGIPARVAGTPAWFGNRTQGNHNWVEVYVGGRSSFCGVTEEEEDWKFLEPSPALPSVDTLEADPCGRWFCDPSRYPSSRVFAAKLSHCLNNSKVFFPLAWEWDCQDVPAVDRTAYYARVCGTCDNKKTSK
jgi:hypothetical protein